MPSLPLLRVTRTGDLHVVVQLLGAAEAEDGPLRVEPVHDPLVQPLRHLGQRAQGGGEDLRSEF